MIGTLFVGTALLYGLACWNSYRYYRDLDPSADREAVRWLVWAFLSQGLLLAFQWIDLGQVPLVHLPGILSVLAFCLSFGLLSGRRKAQVPVLNSFFLPLVLFLSLAALGLSWGGPNSLPGSMAPSLAGHIFLTFLGFSFFTLAFGVAVAFWVQDGQLKRHRIKAWSYRLPALELLDGLTAYYTALGIVFWLGGLALGAFQALQVWDRLPWQDPKILGSFLVLVIYAGFFLLRWGLRARGRKSMGLVLAGYLLALFTFVGVRVFLTTQHQF